ncbi:outer membrane protein [Legionella nagasakiensis]|uniref:outer membrane protein n=1 Tax=Legionella nagasakiensis TaxID=535290 RepID=UPI001056D77F|nr:outer membrane beta-barrel protein [Legionella nagasakiensis]
MRYPLMLPFIIFLGMVTNGPAPAGVSGYPIEKNTQSLQSKISTAYFNKIVSLSAGYDWIKAAQPQSVSLIPPFENYYTVNNNSRRSVFMGGLFLGVEYWQNPLVGVQLGLGGYVDSATDINGMVWQFGLPEFANLNYSYRIQSQRLVVEGKLLTTLKNRFHPYLSGNVGVSSNKAYAYEEQPLSSEIVPMSPFANQDQTSLTFSVGGGLDVDLFKSLRLGVGYQYFRLGKFSLGTSVAQETSQTLAINRMDGHELRFQLTFVA